MKPLRILHISTRLIIGGSQENTVLSCEGQARLGHDVHLAFGPIYGPEGSMLARVAAFRTADGRAITTHEVPDLVRDLSPRHDLRAYHQLRALIRHLRPDIVHTHSSKAGILGRLAAWHEMKRNWLADPSGAASGAASGGPSGGPSGGQPAPEPGLWAPGIVHTIHGPPFMPAEGSAARRLKTRLVNTLYTLAERRAARRCHLIVSVADAMTAQFLARGIGRPAQYRTVYSGMETDAFLAAGAADRAEARRAAGVPDDRFVVGTVARLAEHKGHDDLLDALAPIARERNLHLLWVGDGWWRPRLEARLAASGLAERVTLTGLVPPERVPALIRAMDLLVHPSLREGLPRTVPQALLTGVPVVAYDVDGTREACIDGVTGRLVPPGDREGLRRAVLWMLESDQRRRATAEAGRELCRTRFAAQTMVHELEKIYALALDS
ncbi:MAG: glycosyltransferase family 4 protein [Phycisphaerales bacterium]|nr:glycosyltransferase family 4 protein [Phycisphaerales bacterium]